MSDAAVRIRAAVEAALAAMRELGQSGSRYRRSVISDFQNTWNLAVDDMRRALLTSGAEAYLQVLSRLRVDGVYGVNTRNQLSVSVQFFPVRGAIWPAGMPARADQWPTYWTVARTVVAQAEAALGGATSPAPSRTVMSDVLPDSVVDAVRSNASRPEWGASSQQSTYGRPSGSSGAAMAPAVVTDDVREIDEPLIVTAEQAKSKETWPWIVIGVAALGLVGITYLMVQKA